MDGLGRLRYGRTGRQYGGSGRGAAPRAGTGGAGRAAPRAVRCPAHPCGRDGGAATPALLQLTAGIGAADSWGTDGHKWLNVPYDAGYAFCAHPDAHRSAMMYTTAYLTGNDQQGVRSPGDYVPDSSRRARGFATWAALRQLGRSGVADLVDRCCLLARRFAEQLAGIDGVEIVNDVVLNQVLVSFGDDHRTDEVIVWVQASGEMWAGRSGASRPGSAGR